MNQNQGNIMGNNGYPMPGQYQMKPGFQIPQEYSGLFIGFIICVVVMMVACLMPLYSMEGQSINYLYNSYNSESFEMASFALCIADGICVIALGVAALVTLIKKKPIISTICQSAGLVLFVNQWLKIKGLMEMSKSYGESDEILRYGSGFYLIAISLIVSIVFAWMIYRKEKYGTSYVGMNRMYPQQSMIMQQPVGNVQPSVEQPIVTQETEQVVEQTAESQE